MKVLGIKLETTWTELTVVTVGVFFAFILYRIIYLLYLSPLARAKIPGPTSLAIQRLSFQWQVATGQAWKNGQRLHSKYGPVVRSGPEVIMVCDKHAIRDILAKTDLDKTPRYNGIRPHLDVPTLFTTTDKAFHRQRRRLVSPAFSIKYLQSLEPFFHQSTKQLLSNYEKRIRNGETSFQDNLYASFGKLAVDIIGETAFGTSFYQLDENAPTESQHWKVVPDLIVRTMQRGILRNVFPPLKLVFKVDPRLEQIMKKLLADRRQQGYTRADILQYLIDVGTDSKRSKIASDAPVRSDDKPLKDLEISDQVLEFLIAGSETTSNSMAYTVMGLVNTPKALEKLYETIPAVPITASLPSEYSQAVADTLLTHDQIKNDKKFTYMDAVIKEGLRMFPVAGHMPRHLHLGSEPFQCCGYTIPPGTAVTASYRALHYDPQYWPEPDRFWPERWLDDAERGDAPKADLEAYFPFSAGSRNCIGQNFAWMEMRLTLVSLFQRYRLEQVPNQDIHFQQFVTLQLRGSKWMVKLTPRILPV